MTGLLSCSLPMTIPDTTKARIVNERIFTVCGAIVVLTNCVFATVVSSRVVSTELISHYLEVEVDRF